MSTVIATGNRVYKPQEWPPNYTLEFMSRQARLRGIREKGMEEHARMYYADHPVEFIEHWCVTYDPRNAGSGIPTTMPFVLFRKQKEFVYWVLDRIDNKENGLVEKSRDMGATWVCVALSVWLWLYRDGASIGWGSRKEMLVDRLGDPDSIFEKIRMMLRYLPDFLLPRGMNERTHISYMKIQNPDNEATITGEAGDNIGRGGRKLIYFKDESAHYDHAELIEAALADNTNTQIDISSVQGAGNVFYRKRHSGMTEVFVMDWRDHPAKNDEWYDKRKADAEANGLEHIFAQEVDRDYTAAIEGILIPAKHVKAAIDAHIKLGFEAEGERVIGLDVADEGGDKNAMCDTHGSVVQHIEQWALGDTGKTATHAYNYSIKVGADNLTYDSIGVGAGVKAKTRELLGATNDEIEKLNDATRIKLIAEGKQTEYEPTPLLKLKVVGFNAGDGVYRPERKYVEGKKNKDMFMNLKAQAWWAVRDRFHKTYLAVTEGKEYDPSELISLPSGMPLLHDLVIELSRPKRDTDNAGRVKVESKKEMKRRGVPSPNLADALIMCYQPKKVSKVHIG